MPLRSECSVRQVSVTRSPALTAIDEASKRRMRACSSGTGGGGAAGSSHATRIASAKVARILSTYMRILPHGEVGQLLQPEVIDEHHAGFGRLAVFRPRAELIAKRRAFRGVVELAVRRFLDD